MTNRTLGEFTCMVTSLIYDSMKKRITDQFKN